MHFQGCIAPLWAGRVDEERGPEESRKTPEVDGRKNAEDMQLAVQ